MDQKTKRTEQRLYFAYGSNMEQEQMNRRCRSHQLAGNARLDGYRFRINGRGVATIVPEDGAVVHGLAWSISRQDEAGLDVCEGVAGGLYRKEHVEIILADGDRAMALVYVASDSSKGKFWSEYVNRIIKAAKVRGLPPEYIQELKTWTKTKRKFSQKEEEYLARLMSGGMDRTRAEWYLNAMQTWTREDYVEYEQWHLAMMDGIDGEEI